MPPEVDFAEALVALTAQIQDLKTKLEVQASSIVDLQIRAAQLDKSPASPLLPPLPPTPSLSAISMANSDIDGIQQTLKTMAASFDALVLVAEGCEDLAAHVGGLSQATVALPLLVFIGFRPGGIASSNLNTKSCAIQLFDKIPKTAIAFNMPPVSKMQDHCLPTEYENAKPKFIWPQQVTTIEQINDVDFIGVSLYLEPLVANSIHCFLLTRQSDVVVIMNDVILLVVIAVDDVNSLSTIKENLDIMREKHPLVFIGFRPGLFLAQPSRFIFAQIPSMSLVSTIRMFVSFCGCSSIFQALRVLNAMDEQLRVAWSVLITAYVQHSSYDKAFHMFKKKNSLGIQSNELQQTVKGRQLGWLGMISAARRTIWFGVQAICKALGQLVCQLATAIHISRKPNATPTIARSLQQKKMQSQAYLHHIQKGLGTYCSVALNPFNLEDKVVVKGKAMLRARVQPQPSPSSLTSSGPIAAILHTFSEIAPSNIAGRNIGRIRAALLRINAIHIYDKDGQFEM
ncbi:hypothetical protein CCACVL1_26991 [Corchorus capsularis]|uniref:Uncharacterized protein n=1 Tax=Corchorus capsularis TaxID=210143 RepID=A0A1R3GCK9_COCAP|nr:hypothetical protein CCACVL1_26991 [Corchorus capsularis]